jgi:sialate O-acetylesterase
LPNTGEVVTFDLGLTHNIHLRNQQEIGRRLARWALAHEYDKAIPYSGPRYESMSKENNRCLIQFDYVGAGLQTHDGQPLLGFAIAGADRQWYWANTEIVDKNTVAVFSDDVPDPVAVRYCWPRAINAINLRIPISLFSGMEALRWLTRWIYANGL